MRVRPPPPAPSPTLLLGAHVSAAGGHGNAPGNAEEIGAECFAVFTRNQRRWRSPPIPDEEAARYGAELARVAAGLRRITENLDRCLDEAGAGNEVMVLLENTAGMGTSLGAEPEQQRDLLGASRHPGRLGDCVDTSHAFAAGYDLRTRASYEETVARWVEVLGAGTIRAWHLDDSQRPLGSRVDRHADLGEGELGLDPFLWLVQDPRWAGTPGILETPGGPERWAEDIARLRAALPGQDEER